MANTTAETKQSQAAFLTGLSLLWVFASTLHLIAQLDSSSQAPSWAIIVWLIALPFWSVSLVIYGVRWLRLRSTSVQD